MDQRTINAIETAAREAERSGLLKRLWGVIRDALAGKRKRAEKGRR